MELSATLLLAYVVLSCATVPPQPGAIRRLKTATRLMSRFVAWREGAEEGPILS